jgi:hypothetical protein
MHIRKNPRSDTSRDSPWVEFLIGTLVLAICFLGLCAYASHQRDGLLRAGRNLEGTPPDLAGTAKAMAP